MTTWCSVSSVKPTFGTTGPVRTWVSQRLSVKSSIPSGDVSDNVGDPEHQTLCIQGPESCLKSQPLSDILHCKKPPCFPSGIRFLFDVVYCKSQEQEYMNTCLEEERNVNERSSYELKIKKI